MKKLFIAILSIFLLVSCGQNVVKKESNIGTDNKKQTLTKQEKIDQFKRRAAYRSIITKWDFYSIKSEKETALRYYISAYSRLKTDIILERKIADTYFELKNFEKALEFYKKVPSLELDNNTSEKMALALMYQNPRDLKQELEKINIPDDEKDYFGHIFACYNWLKNCISDLKSYTGSYNKTSKLINLLTNFEKTWNSDSNYKYALMWWQFFENKDYLATVKLWEETLSKRPDYKSVLKLTWFAYYELWNYKKANDLLQKYYNIDPKDVKISYLLWIINFNLENYLSSNLYFNSAVLNGYTPKLELEKRLAYNYYVIWDKKNMLKIFRYMIDEDWITEDDYSIALYTAIEDNEFSKAMLWVNKWILKFSTSDNMYAFRWWLNRLISEQDNAIRDLEKSLSLNPKNSIALLNLWIVCEDKNDFDLAKKYFTDTIDADKNWAFSLEAQDELKNVQEKEKELSQSWQIQEQSGQTNTGSITNN